MQQLIDDFRDLFWKQIGADAAWRPEKMLDLLPSLLEDTIRAMDDAGEDDRVVIFSTIQALQQVHSGPHFASSAGGPVRHGPVR